MDKVLKATKRTVTGKQVKQLRRQGQLPAVIYGRHVEPIVIALNAHEAGKIIPRLSSSSLVTINVDGTEYSTLVREKQKDYIKNRLTHIDFLAVSLDEKLRAYVRIELTGTAPAVQDFNAYIVTGLNEVEVECFPQDLPEKIVVDISGIKVLGDGVHVRDLVAPDKVRLLDDIDEMIVVATATKEEKIEEVVVAVEAATTEEPEVIEKGKKEEEEEAEA
jgi:large subunit ribosomal protein L25